MNMTFIRAVSGFFASLALVGCGGGSDTPAPQIATIGVTSTAFADGAAIPIKYTGLGTNTSPPLSLTGIPSTATSLAVVMDDEVSPCGTGNNACVHWGVFNLPSTKSAIAENETLTSITGVVLGKAYNDLTGYQGPNPPSAHIYKITVYALNSSATAVPETPAPKYTRSQFETQFSSNIVGKGTLTGTFSPTP